jgi:hypothetical protein
MPLAAPRSAVAAWLTKPVAVAWAKNVPTPMSTMPSTVDVIGGGGIGHDDRHSQVPPCRLQLLQLRRCFRVAHVGQNTDPGCAGHDLSRKLHLLGRQSLHVRGNPGHIASRPRHARDQSQMASSSRWQCLVTIGCNRPSWPRTATNPCLLWRLGATLKVSFPWCFISRAIGLSFLSQWMALCIYVMVALMWLVPDRRIEAFAKKE